MCKHNQQSNNNQPLNQSFNNSFSSNTGNSTNWCKELIGARITNISDVLDRADKEEVMEIAEAMMHYVQTDLSKQNFGNTDQ